MPLGDFVQWPGASGKHYHFYVFELPDPPIPTDEDGNYIFTKHQGGEWRAIYIGQGNLVDRIAEGVAAPCIQTKDATHVHVQAINEGENVRRNIERDLLAYHDEAYVPTGCNVREGG